MACEFCAEALGRVFASTIIALGFSLILVIFLAVYIYFALAWQSIAKKLNYKRPWLAWIPFANVAMVLQLGGFNWALVFLFLIPIFGWVALLIIGIIAKWRIFEKRKYPGWFSLAVLIPQFGALLHMVVLAFVAWVDKKKK